MTQVHPFDPGIKFVQARHYTWIPPTTRRKASMIAIHSMEAPDKPTTAEAVAAWFAGPSAPQASAHVCIDSDSAVASVWPSDEAWACGASNLPTYSAELAGYAKQSRAEWLTPPNLAMLQVAALHLAKACGFLGIPATTMTDEEVGLCLRDDLIRRKKIPGTESGHPGGVTTHAQLNRVWRSHAEYGLPATTSDTSHSDPGDSFPLDVLVNMMRPASGDPTHLPPPPRMPSGTAPPADEGPEEFPLK